MRFSSDNKKHNQAHQDANHSNANHPTRSSQMTREEALEILGLKEGCSDEEVKEAHRRLIQKVHPDQGGNDYLAAKLNDAKKALTG